MDAAARKHLITPGGRLKDKAQPGGSEHMPSKPLRRG